jgi:hypothetical protein
MTTTTTETSATVTSGRGTIERRQKSVRVGKGEIETRKIIGREGSKRKPHRATRKTV